MPAFVYDFGYSVEGVTVEASGYDGVLHEAQLVHLPNSLVGLGQAHRGPVDGEVHLLVS